MNPDEFRKAGYRVIDWIADYRAGVEARPVMAKSAPGDIKAMLPASPPQQPESFDTILGDLDRVVLPGITTWQHPRFFGYFPSNALLSSVLGDYVSTGLGVIGLAWQSSPALTEVEEVVTDWMRQMLGLSEAWSGVINDTASTSTLVALLCARERASEFSLAKGGLQDQDRPLIVYTSAHSHSSVEKAAVLAGFGKANVRIVPHEGSHAMRPESLENMVKDDILNGRRPCVVVATTGTTTSTALDPIERLAQVAKANNLWLHVDAAMAGSAMILPECRWMWHGVEGADSVIVNAHKWLGAVFDCTIYFVRDPEHLVRVMSTNPSYLQTAADGRVNNYRDWGLPLGRRFRALKLWFLIREQGVEGLQARLRRDIDNAKWLVREIANTPCWKVLAPVPLQTLCVRHEPPGLEGEALDKHTLEWAARLNQSGQAYVTPALLDGRWMVRVSIGAELTERQHVEQLWSLMTRAVEAGL
ncbi:MAG: aminotransferase class V-fold PLP-dependent enzyme [Cyanobacteria bacterium]|nr:aminotransferase class V-fold PLP-dependent enzyme [Cyanobacteriota bacterium]